LKCYIYIYIYIYIKDVHSLKNTRRESKDVVLVIFEL